MSLTLVVAHLRCKSCRSTVSLRCGLKSCLGGAAVLRCCKAVWEAAGGGDHASTLQSSLRCGL